jgi:DNA-binding GntR family transcriptional regulator
VIVHNTVSDSGNNVYQELRREIVDGDLLPGEHLVEEELCERLGVGRGTVRLALVRLEHDGLVVRERHRGARVRRVTAAEAVEILQAQAALEGLAAGYAARHADNEAIANLRTSLSRMKQLREEGDLLAVSDTDAVFHRQILELAQNETLLRLSELLSSQFVRFQYRAVLLPGRASNSHAEHERIVNAIAAHDGPAAEAAMRRHLSGVANALAERLDEASQSLPVVPSRRSVPAKPARNGR